MTLTRTRIVVVGSANLDQVLTVPEAPGPGVTVSAREYAEEPGGKGLNQALAAARAGAEVAFVGAVGDDAAGGLVRDVLVDAGVDVAGLRRVVGPTGRAVIVVDEHRENRIVLLGGANRTVTSLTEADRAAITRADTVLLQLELPLSVVGEAAEVGHAAGVRVALTPAPVVPLPPGLLDHVSLVFANEHELAALTGHEDLEGGLRALLELVPAAVVTRGARGSDYADRAGRRHHQEALPVEAVDTTAAGDVFAGMYAAAYGSGDDGGGGPGGVEQAMRRASAAAGLAVTRAGTSGSIPTDAEIEGVDAPW